MYNEYTEIEINENKVRNDMKKLSDVPIADKNVIEICGETSAGFFQKPFTCVFKDTFYIARRLNSEENDIIFNDDFPEYLIPRYQFSKDNEVYLLYRYATATGYRIGYIIDNLINDIIKLHRNQCVHGDIHFGNISPDGNLLDPGLIGVNGDRIRTINKTLYNKKYETYCYEMDEVCFYNLTKNLLVFQKGMNELWGKYNKTLKSDNLAMGKLVKLREDDRKKTVIMNPVICFIVSYMILTIGMLPICLVLLVNRGYNSDKWFILCLSPCLILVFNCMIRRNWMDILPIYLHLQYLAILFSVVVLIILVWVERGFITNVKVFLIITVISLLSYAVLVVVGFLNRMNIFDFR